MRDNLEMAKTKAILFFILVSAAFVVSKAIVSHNIRLLYLILGFGVFALGTCVIKRKGLGIVLWGLVFIYWIPLDSRLQTFSLGLTNVYPVELGVWALFYIVMIYRSLNRTNQDNVNVSKFPLLPFSVLLGGALITYWIAEYHSVYSVIQIRMFCLFPALFCFLCICLIKNVKQAERLLWTFLISAGLLGLVFLYVPNAPPAEWSIMYRRMMQDDRLMKIIKIPLCGVLFMNAEVTPVNYAFIVALSFNFWLNHNSFRKRFIAMILLVISALVIIKSQGRTGLIAAGSSIIAITAITLRARKSFVFLIKKILWKALVSIGCLFSIFLYYANTSAGRWTRQRALDTFSDPSQAPGLADRVWRWRESFLVAIEHPFFGVGIEGFQKHNYIYSWFAHNMYLYLWLSFGIIGLIGFLWIFTRLAKAYWSALYSNDLDCQSLAIGGIASIITLLIAGIASSTFLTESWQVAMLWIPFGIIFAAVNLKRQKEVL